MGRKNARKEVMSSVYQMELIDSYDVEAQKGYLKEKLSSENDVEYAITLLKEFIKEKDMVDDHIKMNLRDWTITRLPKVDLAILRVALVEFFFFNDIPIEVSINEAIELAKEYSDSQSAKFINGVLASVVKKENLINE